MVFDKSFIQNLIPYIYVYKGFPNISDNRHILAMCPFFVVLHTFDPQFFIRGLIDSSNQLIIAKGSIQLIQPNTKNRFSSLYYFIFHLHFHSTSHFIVSICLFSPLLSCLLYFIFSNYLLINFSTFCPFFFFFFYFLTPRFFSFFLPVSSLNFSISIFFLYIFLITFSLYTLTPLYVSFSSSTFSFSFSFIQKVS